MNARTGPDELGGFTDSVNDLMQSDGVPGLAVCAIRDGAVVYSNGFGYRDLAAQNPVTPRTLFPIGSSTKAFTAMTVGMLVDEGRLDWDTPVVEYLPDFRLYDEYATLHATPRDLLCHRTGLPRYDVFAFFPPPDREASFRRLRYLHPSAGFREFFQYSNLMYVAAGVLVERLSGISWEQFTTDRILVPLEMTSTNFTVSDLQRSPDFAQPYADQGGAVTKVPFRDTSWAGPAGSVNSNVEEMARWLQLHLNAGEVDGERLIAKQTLAQMHMPQMAINGNKDPICAIGEATAYGMGWMICDHRGHRMLKHGGNIDGFTAQMSFVPEHGLGVVVLTNKSLNVLADSVTCDLYDRLLGLETTDWHAHHQQALAAIAGACGGAAQHGTRHEPSASSPSLPLSDYEGHYRHPAFGRVEIVRNGAKLEGGFSGAVVPLEHVRFDVFRFAEGLLQGLKIRFHLNIDGAVRSLSMQLETGVADIVFDRAREPAVAPSPEAMGIP
jgi:CubicO group peptidase (beta-lactamase class C family)